MFFSCTTHWCFRQTEGRNAGLKAAPISSGTQIHLCLIAVFRIVKFLSPAQLGKREFPKSAISASSFCRTRGRDIRTNNDCNGTRPIYGRNSRDHTPY
jgi:hypothetical protein